MLYDRTLREGVNPQLVSRVADLFQSLQWTTHDPALGEAELFSKFCSMLFLLRPEEQDLVLTLSRDFFHCSLAKYDAAVSLAIQALQGSGLDLTREIIAVPLTKPADIGSIKSSGLVLYLFKYAFGRVAAANGWTFRSFDRVSLLKDKCAARQNAIVILADDFLGSGRSAVESLTAYRELFSVPSDTVVVVALVAQRQAFDAVTSTGATCIAPYVRARGISDSASFPDKASALRLMDDLEARLRVRPEYRRGFQQSEATVCMVRCPNNTFPVYWTTKKVSGRAWPAPFPR